MLTSVFDQLYAAINRARSTGATCVANGEPLEVALAQVEEAQRACQGLATAQNAARALEQLNLAAECLRTLEGEYEESDRAVTELRAVLTQALQGLSLAASGESARVHLANADTENPEVASITSERSA